jgi:hypothetical protein
VALRRPVSQPLSRQPASEGRLFSQNYEDHIGGIVSNGLTIADLRKRNAVGGFFNRSQQRINDSYRDTNAGSQPMQNLRPWYQQVPPVTPWGGGAFYEPHVAEAIFNQFVMEQSANLTVAVESGEDAVARRNAETVERSLVYVALTRSKKTAAMTGYGELSPFMSGWMNDEESRVFVDAADRVS